MPDITQCFTSSNEIAQGMIAELVLAVTVGYTGVVAGSFIRAVVAVCNTVTMKYFIDADTIGDTREFRRRLTGRR